MTSTPDHDAISFPASPEPPADIQPLQLPPVPWSSGSSMISLDKTTRGLKDHEMDSPSGSSWGLSAPISLREFDSEKNLVSILPSSLNASNLSMEHGPPPAPPAPQMTMKQQAAFISITCVAQLLSLSALFQTVAPVKVLADYYHIDNYGDLSWFSAAYSMTLGTFILPAGRLGDMYGHKKVYLIGWLWFAIWSLIAGFSYAGDHVLFSICRAFQGIGPALLVPNAVALIGRTIPIGPKRMIGFACFGACGPLGATMGSVFSGLIADLAWWPWNFWVLTIVCMIIMLLAHFILPADSLDTSAFIARRPKFDYWGTITGVPGLILVNFAFNQAPLALWTTPYIGTLLGVGILLLIAFVLVELYATDQPLIPIRGLSSKATFALICIVAGWASHGIWVYDLYLFLEWMRGHSSLLAAAQISPVAITGVLFALSTVWLLQRFDVAYVMFLAMTFFMVGSLLLATMPVHQTYWAQTFVSVLLMPGAMNLSYPAATMLLSSSLPKEQQGIAASLVSTLVNYSISVGLGLAGTIDRYSNERAARKAGWTRAEGNPAPLSISTPEIQRVRLAGLRASWWFAVALGAAGMAIAGVFVIVVERRKRTQRKTQNPLSPVAA